MCSLDECNGGDNAMRSLLMLSLVSSSSDEESENRSYIQK